MTKLQFQPSHHRYRCYIRTKPSSSQPFLFLLLIFLAFILSKNQIDAVENDDHVNHVNHQKPSSSTNHDSNVAILVSSSTFFHNYRHTTNALALYKALKKHGGYTDDNIILFLGDEVACNDRNPFKNKVYPYPDHSENLFEEFHTTTTTVYNGDYDSEDDGRDDDDELNHESANSQGKDEDEDEDEGSTSNHDRDRNVNQQFHYNDNVQVDYSGSDVTVENFFRVLLGRHNVNTPPHQRINSINNDNAKKTNLLLYMTGHGGDNFFKFRDQEDFTTADLRGALEQAQIMNRFNSVLFISDTCQAFTMAPNTPEEDEQSYSSTKLKDVYTVGTSLKGESSYAHHTDRTIGHSVMDRYIHYFMDYMEGTKNIRNRDKDETYDDRNKWSKMDTLSLEEALVDSMYNQNHGGTRYGSKKLGVDVGFSDHGCSLKMGEVPLSDFFVMKQNPTNPNVGGSANAELILEQVNFWI